MSKHVQGFATKSGPRDRQWLRSIVCNFDRFARPNNDWLSHGAITGLILGETAVYRYEGYGVAGARRTFTHISADRSDDFLVVFPLMSTAYLSQCGRNCIVGPGHCTVLATSRPFEGYGGISADDYYSEYIVRLPGPLLRQRIPVIDESCACRIDLNTSGAARVFQALLGHLILERENYSESQACRFGSLVFAGAENILFEAAELKSGRAYLNVSAHSDVVRRADLFIQSNLSNSQLNPALVARNCRVSLSYLHSSFADTERTVGETIKEHRLQRCREALHNPLLKHKPITQIAYLWGFSSGASFSHSYRTRFGVSPKQDRNLALRSPVSE